MTIRQYHYPNREAWLADRPNFIGASEVASCIGAPGAYQSRWELWARKTRKLPAIEETEYMAWGQRLERSIALGVQADHGGHVDVPGDIIAYGPADAPHQRATPDAFWSRHDGRRVLEIKNVREFAAEDWEDGVPDHVFTQVVWQMYCAGIGKASVAALIGGNRLVVHDVEYDAKLALWLSQAVNRFWSAVEKGEEPGPEARDVPLLPQRWRARRGDAAEVSAGLVSSLLDAQEREKAAKQNKDGLRALLMQELGEATEGQIDGQTVCTWRETKSGSRTFRIHRDAESVVNQQQERAAS